MGSPVHRVSLRDTWSRRVHPDIDSERRLQPFSVERLTSILDGSVQNTVLRRRVESIIQADPMFDLRNVYFMTDAEQYEDAVQKKFHLEMLARRLGWSEGGPERNYANRALSGYTNLSLHGIAMNAIRSLGSDEQIAKWDQLSKNFQIITTYAQTELGHGTYLKGLETEATYDAATQEFVIHSPTITSTKWWPGDLGRSVTHAVVLAQLICSGAQHGMHAFIVPIRSLQDHTPLPGITVGDIGPKMGLEHIDNGFLQLNHMRVPRENMLSRFGEVLPDGTYRRLGTAQSNYLPMLVTRVSLLITAILPFLQKSCVIAVRYSVIRHQSRLRPSDPEAKILDFQTQQQKLLPQLALSYAFHFTATSLLEFFHSSYSAILKKDFSPLPELHALSTGMKAMFSDFCAQGAEICRRACGGHGYSKLSGLPTLVTRVIASCTYEGENTVLYLQVARFLMKSYLQAQVSPTSQKPLPQSVMYLASPRPSRCPAQTAADFLCPDIYTTAWAHVSARLIKDAVHHTQSLMRSGLDQHDAWNQTAVIHLQAAKAHCYYITVKSFKEAVEKLDNEPEIQQVLQRLCDLCALYGILMNSGDFLHDGFLSGAQVDMARAAFLGLLPLIRKDAILLTDAFDFTDHCLNSALGCYDGHVYERLFEWAQKSPANTQKRTPHLIIDGWEPPHGC
ncbi:peroxisomal acyl-coenzyme A oxidase 2 isoform X2 [Meriones unguiculatus]|uniref:peroxisomal acyl-coenzyme A oxidase 2 isoform X2 n=1 Tax=Meriones unguiculatus TaxID=10047 RepID=UPI00293F4285|nr:peroxisomal acyl-coenzyme A oxidase 2 isoform X2 [Meriones unguiculatus]